MKKFKKTLSVVVALVLTLSFGITAFAAEAGDATIDKSKTGTLNVYKYDVTAAEEAGVETDGYAEDGEEHSEVPKALSKYAIQGVEFTYLKIADIETVTTGSDGKSLVRTLYGLTAEHEDLLKAMNLKLADAEYTKADKHYFSIDTLSDAIAAVYESNSTKAKNAFESYIKTHGGTAMPETDAAGHASASSLPLGLYFVVETRVPENVISTTNPFFVSLPSTTADGDEWIYNVYSYPKNQTGNPTLEKTLREDKDDTGKNQGSEKIDDGYAHTGTASVGDTVEYQFISTLPAITSSSTYLTTYTFVDTAEAGLTYNRDVEIEFFEEAECTTSIATWTSEDVTPKFAVSYGVNTMTITMTAEGLAEINTSAKVYGEPSDFASGYSTCTMRITYSCELNEDAVLGDAGNNNAVELTWKRTNTAYYDTLYDDCHVYTYGIDLTKSFENGEGNLENVKFVLQNSTDGYFVKASFDEESGVYTVTGHTAVESEATSFVPTKEGKIIIRGLEDDKYTVTETETDDGYLLLEKGIVVEITASEGDASCERCYANLLTAAAKVNEVSTAMTADGNSASAFATLSVVNYGKPFIPVTGDTGVWVLCIAGAVSLAAGVALLIGSRKKQEN